MIRMKLGPSDLEIISRAWNAESMSKSILEGNYAEVHSDDLDCLLERLEQIPGDAFIICQAIKESNVRRH